VERRKDCRTAELLSLCRISEIEARSQGLTGEVPFIEASIEAATEVRIALD